MYLYIEQDLLISINNRTLTIIDNGGNEPHELAVFGDARPWVVARGDKDYCRTRLWEIQLALDTGTRVMCIKFVNQEQEEKHGSND